VKIVLNKDSSVMRNYISKIYYIEESIIISKDNIIGNIDVNDSGFPVMIYNLTDGAYLIVENGEEKYCYVMNDNIKKYYKTIDELSEYIRKTRNAIKYVNRTELDKLIATEEFSKININDNESIKRKIDKLMRDKDYKNIVKTLRQEIFGD